MDYCTSLNLAGSSYSQSPVPVSSPKLNSFAKSNEILGSKSEKHYSLSSSESIRYNSSFGVTFDNQKSTNNDLNKNDILTFGLENESITFGNLSKDALRSTVLNNGNKPRLNLFANYNHDTNYRYDDNKGNIETGILTTSIVNDHNAESATFDNYRIRSSTEKSNMAQLSIDYSAHNKISTKSTSDHFQKYRTVLYGRKGNGYQSRLATIEESIICIEFINNMKRDLGFVVNKNPDNNNTKNDGGYLGINKEKSFTYSPNNTSLSNNSIERYCLSRETGKVNNKEIFSRGSFNTMTSYPLNTIDKRERSYSEPNPPTMEINYNLHFPLYKRSSFSSYANNDCNSHKIPGIHEGCLSRADRSYLHDTHMNEGSRNINKLRTADYPEISSKKGINQSLGSRSENRISDLLNDESEFEDNRSVFPQCNLNDVSSISCSRDITVQRDTSNEKFSRKLSKYSENKLKTNNKKRLPKTLKHGICVQCGITETTQWRTINIYSEGKVCNSCGMFSNKLESMFGKVATKMILQRKKLDGTSLERKMSSILKEHHDIIEQFGDNKN